MANLSKVTDVTRKFLELFFISIAALIGLYVLFTLGVFVKNLIAPPIPPGPSVAFGKLTFDGFPLNTNIGSYTYSINTLSGTLPTLPDRINVYALQNPSPDLLGLTKAKSIANAAGFSSDPVALSESAYLWTKTDPLPTRLTMDTAIYDFTLSSDYKNDPTVTSAANLPDEGTALTVSNDFFTSVMSLPKNIDPNKTKITLWAITPGGLLPATSLSTAQIIRIDYFPQNVDTLPIYTASPNDSLIYTLVGSAQTTYPQILEAQYIHKILTGDKATYPIKTADEAFNDLKNGKGFIAANPSGGAQVTITDVTLGYYIDTSAQGYLWPIIVFQGNQGFYAYVSAVQDTWIK